eukprot:9473300-Pyramimonas_sp.AAC.1
MAVPQALLVYAGALGAKKGPRSLFSVPYFSGPTVCAVRYGKRVGRGGPLVACETCGTCGYCGTCGICGLRDLWD